MPLVVDTYQLGPVGTNCHIVRREPGATDAVVVDPGADAEVIRQELEEMKASCPGILITHGHFDHLGGVADLAEGTGAQVYMADAERAELEQPQERWGFTVRAHAVEHPLTGDETIELAGIVFETIPIPGHSPGHVAFAADDCLFSGDLLFAGSVGRVDLPGADWDTLVASVRTLADRLPPETTVYPGHGRPTTLGDELARNPFLAELRA